MIRAGLREQDCLPRPKVAREKRRQQPENTCMYDTRVLGAGDSLSKFLFKQNNYQLKTFGGG